MKLCRDEAAGLIVGDEAQDDIDHAIEIARLEGEVEVVDGRGECLG